MVSELAEFNNFLIFINTKFMLDYNIIYFNFFRFQSVLYLIK